MPDEWFGEVGVQETLRAREMPYEKSYDEADHRQVFAAIHQYRDQIPIEVPCSIRWSHTRSNACSALKHGYGPTPVPRVPAPNVLIADVESVCTSYIEFALVYAERIRYEWSVSLIKAGKLAHANARCMIEQAVQHSDAVSEVGLKQRHERAAVPRSRRNYADASCVVTANPFGIEFIVVDLVIEVVRLGQLDQKSAAAAGKCSPGVELLHGGSEPQRCILRDPAKDRLAVVTKVWTQQCQQLENVLVLDLAGHSGRCPGRRLP